VSSAPSLIEESDREQTQCISCGLRDLRVGAFTPPGAAATTAAAAAAAWRWYWGRRPRPGQPDDSEVGPGRAETLRRSGEENQRADHESRGGGRGAQNQSREERQQRQEERAKANEKALAEILKPDQLKRAKQISWQQQGAQAVSVAEVAAALKLTDEQKD